jgi:23S rRNA (uracil1939-C5)-methyltransferase
MGIRLTIDKLGARGVGLARVGGKVVMAPLTAPGDRAEVEIIRSHRYYDEARVLRILEPSLVRREPPCPCFGSCGGCQLQHLAISYQQKVKESLFREMLLHRGLVPSEVIGPLLSPPSELGYRSHLDLHLAGGSAPYLGFMGWGEKKVVPVKNCLVALSPLQRLLPPLQVLASSGRLAGIDNLALSCDAPGDNVSACAYSAVRRDRKSLDLFVQALSDLMGMRGVSVYPQKGKHPGGHFLKNGEMGGVFYAIPLPGGRGDALLEVRPGAFRQANPEGNRMLVSTVIGLAERGLHRRIADLYAGVGNFSVPLSYLGEEVVAMEGKGLAVASGKANGGRWGMGNLRWVAGPVRKALEASLNKQEHFDLVVMDPPRTGARDILGELLLLRPGRILYVSCDPATLVRDLRVLLKDGKYRPVKIQPLDMFPQTFHVESITLLEKA